MYIRRGSSQGPWDWLVRETRLSSYPGSQSSWSCLHRILEHSNLRLCRKPRQVIETFLDRPCPTATLLSANKVEDRQCRTDLHGDQSIIYKDFFGKEIGANGGFVACAELLVDLLGCGLRQRRRARRGGAIVHIGSSATSCLRRYRRE